MSQHASCLSAENENSAHRPHSKQTPHQQLSSALCAMHSVITVSQEHSVLLHMGCSAMPLHCHLAAASVAIEPRAKSESCKPPWYGGDPQMQPTNLFRACKSGLN